MRDQWLKVGPLVTLGPLRLLLYGLPSLAIVVGALLIVTVYSQRPADTRAEAIFLADRGCRIDLAAGGSASGACRVVAVRVLDASIRHAGTRKSGDSYVTLAFDGAHRDLLLAEPGGRALIETVVERTSGRVLLFEGAPVRVAVNGIAADVAGAPKEPEHGDATLPWVGLGMIGCGALAFWGVRRAFPPPG